MAHQYAPCSEAKDLFKKLVEKYPEKFGGLVGAGFDFLSQTGGITMAGSKKAAKIEKLTGVKKWYSRNEENTEGADYLITVCAETWGLASDVQKERIIFHEMKHALIDEDKEGAPVFKLVDHEIAGFADEFQIYGGGDDIIGLLALSGAKE
jgi:hypothetical protein